MGGLPAVERVDDIVHKVEQFVDEYAGIDFFFFSEVDQVSVDAIAAGAPFVFVDQRAGILDIVHVV